MKCGGWDILRAEPGPSLAEFSWLWNQIFDSKASFSEHKGSERQSRKRGSLRLLLCCFCRLVMIPQRHRGPKHVSCLSNYPSCYRPLLFSYPPANKRALFLFQGISQLLNCAAVWAGQRSGWAGRDGTGREGMRQEGTGREGTGPSVAVEGSTALVLHSTVHNNSYWCNFFSEKLLYVEFYFLAIWPESIKSFIWMYKEY